MCPSRSLRWQNFVSRPLPAVMVPLPLVMVMAVPTEFSPVAWAVPFCPRDGNLRCYLFLPRPLGLRAHLFRVAALTESAGELGSFILPRHLRESPSDPSATRRSRGGQFTCLRLKALPLRCQLSMRHGLGHRTLMCSPHRPVTSPYCEPLTL